ncbi:MAG: histidine triad nucleotide-binding protein [Peptococcaceae bacterium]|nr:histidine triad nucleotide-binding protein [Peptococcaceae bacterium]
MDCIFCKIANKEIPSSIVYEDDDVIAFNDLNPEAPVHVLVIPKKHIVNLSDAKPEDQQLLGKLMLTIQKIAAEQGVAESGYRVVTNCGEQGGQTVMHMHFHLLGGREMLWPAG